MADEVKTAEQLAAEKEAKDGQLRQADYTKKTQELAELRKELERQQNEWASIKRQEADTLEVAKNVKAAFDSDELVRAVVNGDKATAKKLLGEIEDPDELKLMKSKLEGLEQKLAQKDAQEKNSQFADFVKAEGREMIKKEYDLTDQELAADMEIVRKKNNPYYTWARAAALEKILAKEKEKIAKEAKEEAIKEWNRKLNNTRPVSDGNGVNINEGESDTKKAAAVALEAIKRARGSSG